MKSVKLGANTFSYDDAGEGDVILLLSGSSTVQIPGAGIG